MGHLTGVGIYHRLGKKIDRLTVRAPWNETFHSILRELYSTEEADVVIKMPYSLSTFDRVRKATGYDVLKLKKILEGLCLKGLVIDLCLKETFYYMPSPVVVGIYEFTMMRTGGGVDQSKMAGLFKEYMFSTFFPANFKESSLKPMRTLAHENTIDEAAYVEVLDFEKATALIEEADRLSIGICSCRHEKLHLGEACGVPLDTCSSFGFAADYLIRNNLAKEVSKAAMLENLARSKELGLVLNADNVKRNIGYICHCCGCCCNVLLGISQHGFTGTVVSSGFIPEFALQSCEGCGKCEKACAVGAIEMRPILDPKTKKKKEPHFDSSICLGCGVCAGKCKTGSIKLVRGTKRVINPDSTFERVIRQSLERGNLQFQLFDDPNSVTHKFMQGIVGGFLRLPPVKQALMSDSLRSIFLGALRVGLKIQGKGSVLEI
ncbi:MAG: 4Fe-4S dicluster domain-containing protein [Nitrospirota bacterium]